MRHELYNGIWRIVFTKHVAKNSTDEYLDCFKNFLSFDDYPNADLFRKHSDKGFSTKRIKLGSRADHKRGPPRPIERSENFPQTH